MNDELKKKKDGKAEDEEENYPGKSECYKHISIHVIIDSKI